MPSMTPDAALPRTELSRRVLFDAGEYVVSLVLSHDGQYGLAALGNGGLRRFSLETAEVTHQVDAHRDGALGASVSVDGTRWLSCGHESDAKLWSASGELLRVLPGGAKGWVEHVAWSPIGDRFATACGSVVRVWSLDGEIVFETEPLDSTVSGLCFRSDGTGLAAAVYGGVHVIPLIAGAKRRFLPWKGSLISIAWSPDNKVIACGSQDCSVHFWRLASGQDSEMKGYRFKPKALAWDRESRWLATGGDAIITVWAFRGKGPEGTRPLQLETHRGLCTQLAFSPTHSWLASGGEDMSILLWDPRRGEEPLAYAFLEDSITALAFDRTRPELWAADAHGHVACWSLPT